MENIDENLSNTLLSLLLTSNAGERGLLCELTKQNCSSHNSREYIFDSLKYEQESDYYDPWYCICHHPSIGIGGTSSSYQQFIILHEYQKLLEVLEQHIFEDALSFICKSSNKIEIDISEEDISKSGYFHTDLLRVLQRKSSGHIGGSFTAIAEKSALNLFTQFYKTGFSKGKYVHCLKCPCNYTSIEITVLFVDLERINCCLSKHENVLQILRNNMIAIRSDEFPIYSIQEHDFYDTRFSDRTILETNMKWTAHLLNRATYTFIINLDEW